MVWPPVDKCKCKCHKSEIVRLHETPCCYYCSVCDDRVTAKTYGKHLSRHHVQIERFIERIMRESQL